MPQPLREHAAVTAVLLVCVGLAVVSGYLTRALTLVVLHRHMTETR